MYGWIRTVVVSPRRRRLEAELTVLGQDLELNTALKPEARHTAGAYLEVARTECRAGNIDSGWLLVYRVQECLIEAYTPLEVDLARRALKHEVTDVARFSPSLRSGVVEILRADPVGEDDKREQLARATSLRNLSLSSQYWRLSVTRHFQLLLLLAGSPVLIATLVLVWLAAPHIHEAQWAYTKTACAIAVMLGMLGATTSAAQRSTNVKPNRVITQLESGVASLSRLPIGAVAGLTVWLFSIATTGGDGIVGANLLLAAFGAGFAERLVVQSSPGPGAPLPQEEPNIR